MRPAHAANASSPFRFIVDRDGASGRTGYFGCDSEAESKIRRLELPRWVIGLAGRPRSVFFRTAGLCQNSMRRDKMAHESSLIDQFVAKSDVRVTPDPVFIADMRRGASPVENELIVDDVIH